MFNPVRMQIRLAANSERVWSALTDARALEAWFCEHAEITPDNYAFWGRYTPEAPDRAAGNHPNVQQTAGREIAYDWNLKGAKSRVVIKLLPRDNETIFTVRQNAGESDEDKYYHLEDFWFVVLENLRRYLDGKLCDARVDFTNPMKGMIQHSTEIDASPERVFEVLMNPAEVERWIATKATIDPKVGGEYNLGWGMDDVKIIELVPNEKLSETIPMENGATTLTWTLEASGGKTRLTLTHSGFGADEDVAGYYTGWRAFLNYVRSVAEYGANWQSPLVPLPPEGQAGYSAGIHRAQAEIVDELKTA